MLHIPQFRQSTLGLPCTPQVNVLLNHLGGWNYPANIAREWPGNDSCTKL